MNGPQLCAALRRTVQTWHGVTSRPLADAGGLGVRVDAQPGRGVEASWMAAHRHRLRRLLAQSGALLLRGFAVRTPADFAALLDALGWMPFGYVERSSPRTEVLPGIYSSTDHPADQEIFFHNENSYADVWPRFLAFYCETPATTGGETPLADVGEVFDALPPALRDEFLRRGVRYVRNLGGPLGLSWQEVFQTEDRAVVEALARGAGYDVSWHADGGLRTTRLAPATIRHPETGRPMWFNHVAFFHPSSLPDGLSRELVQLLGEERLPNHVFYGDGGAIPPDAVAVLRATYRGRAVGFSWQRGDVLLLDNARVAHGRSFFTGPRRLWVSMGKPMSGHRDAP